MTRSYGDSTHFFLHSICACDKAPVPIRLWYSTYLIYMYAMTHSYVWHDSFIRATKFMCIMTHSHVWHNHSAYTFVTQHLPHSCVWHDSFRCVTWLMHTCYIIYVCHDAFTCVTWPWCSNPWDTSSSSFMCVTWLIHMRDMTHLHVWQHLCVSWLSHMCDMTTVLDPLGYSTSLIHVCDMTHSYVCLNSFILMTCLIHTYDVTHSYVWNDSSMCDMTHSYVTWLIHMRHDSFICVTWLIHMCDVSLTWLVRTYVWHISFNTWLIHMWHDSFMSVIYFWHYSFTRVTHLVQMCDITPSLCIRQAHHMNVSCRSHGTGWRNPVGHFQQKSHRLSRKRSL